MKMIIILSKGRTIEVSGNRWTVVDAYLRQVKGGVCGERSTERRAVVERLPPMTTRKESEGK
jgi:hypothetical protein